MIWLGKDHGLSAWENSVFRTAMEGMMEQIKATYVYNEGFSLEDITRAVNEIFNGV